MHFTKSKLIRRSIPVLKLPEKKNALFHLLGIQLSLKLLRDQVSTENIGIKVSALITPVKHFLLLQCCHSMVNLLNQ